MSARMATVCMEKGGKTMRDIIFRGKKHGKWLYGHYAETYPVLTADSEYLVKSHIIEVSPFLTLIRVDNKTVGQYTGLNDNDGQRIFEGDIVRARITGNSAYNGYEWPVQRVVFSEGAFGLMDARGAFTSFSGWSHNVKFKVIGNIHDNPELLEVKA